MVGLDDDQKLLEGASDFEMVNIDDAGDLHLEVGDTTTFVVDSRAMARASKVFKTMLSGSWGESRPKDGSQWVVELPEDDADGLEILLNIVHARFDTVPKDPGLRSIFYTCVMADKYDMSRALQPWAKTWCGLTMAVTELEVHEKLWIAWTLGDRASFEAAAVDLFWNHSLDSDGRIHVVYKALARREEGESDIFNDLPEFMYVNRTGIIDRILQMRRHAWATVFGQVERFWDATPTDVALISSTHWCDAAAAGYFIIGVRKLDLDPQNPTCTMRKLIDVLVAINARVIQLAESIPVEVTVELVQKIKDLRANIEQITVDLKNILTETQKRHFRQRASLLYPGLEETAGKKK